jgi:molybdopterin-guanine dinucleotide biosynthesis protein A
MTRRIDGAAIILAGGKGSRLGRDKALIEVGGMRLIEIQIKALKKIFPRIYISAKDARPYENLGAEVVLDEYDESAAIVGLYSALRASAAEANFCVACDMPCIHGPLIGEMFQRLGGHSAVVPESARGLEPTYAVYAKGCCEIARTLIEKREFAFKKLLSLSDALIIPRTEVEKICEGVDPFVNINTQQDLREFQRKFGGPKI